MLKKATLSIFILCFIFNTSLFSEDKKPFENFDAEQIRHLPLMDASFREQFLAKHPEIIFVDNLNIPDAIEIVPGENLDGKIVSRHFYKPGDVLYEMTTLIFSEDQLIIFPFNNEFFLIDNLVHTVRRGNDQREFYYFDSFMNHSCDPNTITFYTSENHFEARALKHIVPGDELTCDYAVFDDNSDGEGFECQCGSPQCRGWIY